MVYWIICSEWMYQKAVLNWLCHNLLPKFFAIDFAPHWLYCDSLTWSIKILFFNVTGTVVQIADQVQ